MTKKSALSLIILPLLCLGVSAQNLQTPGEFLGYEPGDRFTPHYRIVQYVEHVGQNSEYVTIEQYGESYGFRPLIVAFITSPENHGNLERLRLNHLRRAGLLSGDPGGLEPVSIVWLSYGVHGNESSSSEAAMLTLYELAAKPHARQWLENTVVILDPLLNPDGRDRYVNWFNQNVGINPDPYPQSREHAEPWPGGRVNHYMFDLNRDWAWQTQKETRERLALYHQWMPHVHADFHEMFFNSPYYFAPAAEPYHEAITQWQRDFQHEIGRNHARYFDKNFRLYYTREDFDLFYPAYGDTYPTYNGAIGMTYEQAGHSRAGLTVVTAEGDTLTLSQRVLNQHVVGMSTVEIASKNAERLTSEFDRYFRDASENPYSRYKTYVIKGDSGRDKLNLLTSYLDKKGIMYGKAPTRRSVNGYDYRTGTSGSFSLSESDLLIPAHQPKSVLLNVLFEPRTTVIDSLTYDLTAWAVPYAMGLNAFASETRIVPAGEWTAPPSPENDFDAIQEPYAYLVEWNGFEDARFLADLLQKGLRVHFSTRPFETNGKRFERGTLVINRTGNMQLGNRFDELVKDAARKFDRRVMAVSTGMSSSGIDLGSDRINHIKAPKVALVSGSGVSAVAFGEVWHYFDRQLGYPVTVFNATDIGGVNLRDFNVLIMPSGNYRAAFSQNVLGNIHEWVRDGGVLIVMGAAIQSVSGSENFSGINPRNFEDAEDDRQIPFAERERNWVSGTIAGSIYKLELDNTHPLAYGYPDHYYTLRSGSTVYDFIREGWNVGRMRANAHRAGFEGYRLRGQLDDSMVFGVMPTGRGQVVYLADNPLFRGFWHNGKLLFANAVFFVGN